MNGRAENGNGTIRKKRHNLYEGRIMINSQRRSVYGSTKAEVQYKLNKLSQRLSPIQLQTVAANYGYTVQQWLDKWQSEFLIQVTKNTRKRYEMDVRLHILPYIGNIALAELTVSQVQNMYNTLFKNGLSAKSVKCTHGILHESLNKAIELGYISANVTENCSVPKLTAYEMKPMNSEEVNRFLAAIKGHRYEDVYYTALFTGMRESELMGLTWDCVDLENGTIRIYRQLQRTHEGGEYEFRSTKNNKGRIIKPASDVIARLSRLHSHCIDNCANPAERFVFTDSKGEHMTINMLYKPFKQIAKQIGLGDMRFHDLRHTYAMLSLQSGCDIKTLSSNLGHATSAFTLDRYGHVSEEMHTLSSSRMQQLIESLTGYKRT